MAVYLYRVLRDHWHDVSYEEERAATLANFLARMLNLAYVFYENPKKQKDCIKEWKNQVYERIPPEEFEANEVKELLNDQRCIAFALRRKRNRSGGGHDVLVLLRGTVLSKKDMEENFHIVRETLHTTERVKRTEALVLELVERYGFENVCLVGHSLGAAVAFLIARKFYLKHEQQTVEGHYFNLPFMCLETLLEITLDLFSTEYALFIGTITMLGLKSTFNKFKEMVAGGFRNLLTGTPQKAAHEFAELIGWQPNIYVNPNDRMCKSYINFFEDLKQHGIGKSGMSRVSGILKILGFDAKAHHLCPSANLIILNKGIFTWTSHRLNTWVDVKPRHIRIKSFIGNDDQLQANRKLRVEQTQMLMDKALRSHGRARMR